MNLSAWVNGRFVALEDACIHIEDRGFQFADGVYEVIACIHGHFLDMTPHLDRLERSCAAIELPLPCPRERLESLIEETWRRNPFDDAMLYIQVTRGVSPRAHLAPDTLTPSLIITSRELPAPNDEKLSDGASGITLEDFRWKRCDIKSIALLASVMGKQEAHRRKADEAFWTDADGHVLEGCSTNILAVINGVLVTHPLDHQVLGGITRNMVLSLASKAGVEVAERPWKLDETGLSECMLTSTTNAVLPVCRMNGESVGNGKPGPICLQLRAMALEQINALRHE